MSRSVPLWVGKTHDSKVPPRVRARVFLAHNGVCYLSGIKIRPGDAWELEHIIALVNGGSHSEDNLAPALVDKHKGKTAEDMKTKAKIARVRNRHLGIEPKKQKIPGSKGTGWKKRLDGTVIRRIT